MMWGWYWSWLQRSARKNPAHAGSTARGGKFGEEMGSRTRVRRVGSNSVWEGRRGGGGRDSHRSHVIALPRCVVDLKALLDKSNVVLVLRGCQAGFSYTVQCTVPAAGSGTPLGAAVSRHELALVVLALLEQ